MRAKALLTVAAAVISWLLLSEAAVFSQANPYRGLWVGDAKLRFVNEVSVPLDANNNPIAPDPNITTPTADRANIRLLLHVNGAGQATLLKEVAVLSRTGSSNITAASAPESDLALVTDERLYGSFPAQPAVRLASAVFDFGDSKATELLDAIVLAAAVAVTNPVSTASGNLNTTSVRLAAEAAAANAALPAATAIVQAADVAAAFNGFMQSNFTAAIVDTVAGAADPAAAAQTARTAAEAMRDRSPYKDSRGVEMVDAVLAAIAAAPGDPTNSAQNMASAYADVENTYQRFVAGKIFGDMIIAAADAAAQASTNAGASAATIQTAISSVSAVTAARAEALRIKITRYRDGRATNAVEQVLGGIAAAAIDSLSDPGRTRTTVQSAAEEAGRSMLAMNVARYAVPPLAPTLDYTAFVTSSAFLSSAQTAAQAAAAAAVSERRNNGLYTAGSLRAAAMEGVINALRDLYGQAARVVRTELPLAGVFGPGNGDARLLWDIKQQALEPLGPAALSGVIQLPANHPTNPFRHRRHPDHAVGIDLTRKLRFDFGATPSNELARANFGVARITGVYREEILGLHKPLGPQPQTQPIGLKVEGEFQLNRISLIDTLNAQ